jgi:hypothetical protein
MMSTGPPSKPTKPAPAVPPGVRPTTPAPHGAVANIKVTAVNSGDGKVMAKGTASKGTSTDKGVTILAQIRWEVPGQHHGPPEYEVLLKECTVEGLLDGKPLPHKKYRVTKVESAGTTTLTKI